MKKIFLTLTVATVLLSCKKEEKVTENTAVSDQSVLQADSVKTADSATAIAPQQDPAAFTIDALSGESAGLGKVIFQRNNEIILVYNLEANKGKIKLQGKEYTLDKLTFSENNYEISGNGIKILAENGNFQEVVSDCSYGTFPEISVTQQNHTVKLSDIKVQDCPNYN